MTRDFKFTGISVRYLFGLLMVCFIAVCVSAGGSSEAETPAVTVIGVGQASGSPDIAVVTVGAETTGQDVKAAVEDNREIMDRITAQLESLGIHSKDMRTVNYGIYVDRSYAAPELSSSRVSAMGQAGNTYRITSSVEVTIREIDSVGGILDACVEAGANQVWGIRFTVEDDKVLSSQARERALEDARSKAETLAKFYGLAVGPVLSISEVTGGGAVPLLRAEGLGATSIYPGQSTVSYSIQVTYALE